MATNFFQRWSSRKLAARDDAAKDKDITAIEAAASDTPKDNVDDEILKSDCGLSSIQPDDLRRKSAESVTHSPAAVEAAGHDFQANLDAKGEGEDIAPTLEDVADVSYESGVASFMKSGVEKTVKKAALRKLFLSEEFNYISDMDDCTDDYSNLKALDSSVTKQLRNWMNEAVENIEDASNSIPEAVPELISEQAPEQLSEVSGEMASPDVDHLDSKASIEQETENSQEHDSGPTSAEGETSEETQARQLANEDVLIAEQE